ncbi:cobalt transporter CbiM [Pseudoramibacter sp.]|jgi:cobalt/nickel transport system permease protein|uniref:cobalt transporter CbiM n=1 Tax=Pseudoramibacter sp. TaxID=2034862 RepID=UPI0025FA00BF|nr:cobalt transporter CbiM [Pseudoramibacter sp.]MCH4071550.1 cobalt transporter CbiM [Pseudoramibacter sp.]MCH4105318.1 cobalt transporter CbiM [Pseudoramibacter sp.]
MHIPDNYLSPQTCGVMAAAMVPVWALSVHKVKKELPRDKIPAMGVAAAFSFLAMMFNIPMPGGTTGHAVGGTLIAVLLGPYAACLSMSIALLLQALIFGDGGILSFGANCFNMAFVLPFVGYGIYRLLLGKKTGGRRELISAGLGSYAGINAAAFCAAVEFGIQPMLFRDAAGNALYCPYGLNVSIPVMMIGHLTLFGLAEVIFTVAVLTFVRKTGGQFGEAKGEGKTALPLKVFLVLLIVATPLGLLAAGSAWGEWDKGEIAKTGIGYTPQGMKQGLSYRALMPDYSLKGLPAGFGYILSALIGTALLIIVFKLASRRKNRGEGLQ